MQESGTIARVVIFLVVGFPAGIAAVVGLFGVQWSKDQWPWSTWALIAVFAVLAYAFDVLSADLMKELDRLRCARNAISHSWNIDSLSDFFTKGRLADMHRIEELLSERQESAKEFSSGFKPLAAFRIRLVWIVGRLVYEAAAYGRAKKARLDPVRALYGKPPPKWLTEISKIGHEATREIAKQC